mmetsp:Transcript_115939/g.205252  ORF Transcript_115939/g.205252 Transcript_115939/m.205252 type:complete len:86 (+) Transcript_115939:66-323(+)
MHDEQNRMRMRCCGMAAAQLPLQAKTIFTQRAANTADAEADIRATTGLKAEAARCNCSPLWKMHSTKSFGDHPQQLRGPRAAVSR